MERIIDKIINSYGINSDARMNKFYYNLVNVSRIINKRKKMNEQDYQLLQYFLEKMNRKLDVLDTTSYDIEGPPDIGLAQAVENKLEEATKVVEESGFGLPEGDF